MDKEENENLASDFNIQSSFWIGISDRETEGTFKYVSDASKVAFFSWSGKTQNKFRSHDCVSSKNGQWDTTNCVFRQLPFICQQDFNVSGDSKCPAGKFGFPKCDNCKKYFFFSKNALFFKLFFIDCACSLSGSKGGNCEDDGICECIEGFSSAKCDQCSKNYYGYPSCAS